MVSLPPAPTRPRFRFTTGHYIALVAVWTALTTGLLLLVSFVAPPNTRAVMRMGATTAIVWCLLGGMLMRRWRDPVRDFVRSIRLNWQLKFVLFCTLLALLEEVVTVTCTNLAPLFGVPVGHAYITASANYLDVVCLHSVVVFVPAFVAWALLLKRYDFSPNMALIVFGFQGTLAEVSFGGPQHFAEYGFWTFIYGLMIYLPVYSLPADRGARPPRTWHYLLPILLSSLLTIPIAGPLQLLHHPKIHFPPIRPGT